MFPEGFGIDIFITTTAIVENMRIIETRLGYKIHTSTRQYEDFEKFLIPMFDQSVRTMLDLTYHNIEFLKGVSEIKDVEKFGVDINNNNNNNHLRVNLESLTERFRKEYEEVKGSDLLSDTTKSRLDYSVNHGCMVPVDVWADCVYDLVSHYMENKERVMRELRILWIGRYISFLRETEGKTEEEAEDVLRRQIDVFAERKSRFLKGL